MKAELIIGLITGILFGAIMQKARVLRFEKQIGAILLKDMTIIKFMMSAVLVGMIGVQVLGYFEVITASPKAMNVGAVTVGAILFGIGWAIAGYCPGTSLGAIGEGRWQAIFAIAGMLVGAGIYARIYPMLKSSVLAWKDFGKITLPQATSIPAWVIVTVCCVGTIVLFRFIEKWAK